MGDRASTGIDRKLTDHVSLGVLTRVVPRYIVDEVVNETGSREKRSRSCLPIWWSISWLLATLETDTRMAQHHRLHAVRAHLLEMAGDADGARTAFELAARRTMSLPGRRCLEAMATRLT